MVRAKFRVSEIKRHDYGKKEMRTIALVPVYGNNDPSHENTKFWEASPCGNIELGVLNLKAAEAFELGEEYYVDFTPAKKETAE